MKKKSNEDTTTSELEIWRARALFYAAYAEFNFDKVHKTMLALDWRWGMPGTVPTVEELELTVLGLLGDVEKSIRANKKEFYYESGGIRFKWNRDAREMSLEFILTGITTYADVFTEDTTVGVQYA